MSQNKIFQYSLAVICFIAACHVSNKAPEYMQPEFDTQGHRGCRGLMPENTVPAMLNALGLGVTTLELDVVISADRKVVVSHEPWMGHEIATKPDGSYVTVQEARTLNIYKMNYGEVRKYDVGMRPHPRFPGQQKMKAYKPLLSELLDSVDSYMMTARRPPPFFNIETKSLPAGDDLYHPRPAEFVELLMAVVREKNIEDRVIIQSFDVRTLQYLKEKYPAVRTAMLVEGSDKRGLEAQLRELGFTPDVYSPAYELVTEDLVRDCHSRRVAVIPWTVNDKAEMIRLKKLGVDGIISDFPDLFHALKD